MRHRCQGRLPEAEVGRNVNREEMGRLGLAESEVDDIVAFLLTLADGYRQFHALGLVLVGLVAERAGNRWVLAAGVLMVAGTLLFSGNLYLRALADFHALHAVTPFGAVPK